ncbi:MAG: FoF1 ATP synthase subunit gamma, partial [Chloroflexota bacterium]
MSELSERSESRLENLKALEPLLGALRTLSLSTWQMALKRKDLVRQYKYNYYQILLHVLKVLPKNLMYDRQPEKKSSAAQLLVILGSERGICGHYNKHLAILANEWSQQQIHNFKIWSFGARVQQALKQTKITYEHQGSLSKGEFPQYRQAYQLVLQWIHDYKRSILDGVHILSFRKNEKGTYKPGVTTLLPTSPLEEGIDFSKEYWPPILIQGDPIQILERTIQHLTSIEFFDLILDSIAAENAIRYSLLEEAKENTQELIDSLFMTIQVEKRQTITQQMQELAVGA